MAEISVGIDLGTTNSCISTCWPNGQPRLLRDDSGVGVIPSAVSFLDDGRIEVGPKAKMRLLTDPENTFTSVKRFIGRDMRVEQNRWAASLYPYTLEAGTNGIPLAVTRDRRIPIYQISGHVLDYLKQMGQKALDQEIRKAVITVPANFNEVQRRSTHQAGEFAGFEVLRIFNEPTAAALAYGLGKDEKKIVAVYDFGGGTFDITVLRLEDPIFEVIATSGDMLLGGDDFDRRIMSDMAEQFEKEYGFGPQDDTSLVQRFSLGAERMKCQLTDWIVTAFEDRHVRNPRGSSLAPFHYEINRDRFRGLVSDLVERSLKACDEAFELARMKPSEVDEVILVGGTTRIPFLRQRVREYFGRKPLDRIQPDVVVSIGAAIQAYSLAGGDLIYPARSRDMLPIRKVEARPPAPKPRATEDMELLDDLSEDMLVDEKSSMAKLRGGRTLKGTAPAPLRSAASVPRPSQPPPAAPPRPTAPPQWSSKKTVPLLGSPSRPPAGPRPSRPPAGPRPSEPPERRKGQTLRYAPALGVPGPVEPGAEVAVRKDVAGTHGFELPDPFGREDLPQRKVSLGHEFTPTLDEPTLDGPDPGNAAVAADPFEEPTSEIDGEMIEVVEPGSTPAEQRPSRRARSPLESTQEMYPPPEKPQPTGAFTHPDVLPPQDSEQPAGVAPSLEELLGFADEEPFGEPSEQTAVAPLHLPEVAPLVTAEATSQPYVSGDVLAALREDAAAPEHDAVAEAISDAARPVRAPLLLDVTPNTLGVATVGGFVEVLVRKNSPVPIEKKHLFTTSVDNQEKAVIKVLEGESSRADQNHVLGEVELSGFRKAPRGDIKIEVSYEITVDGILQVSGRNLDTGEAQTARLTLFGG